MYVFYFRANRETGLTETVIDCNVKVCLQVTVGRILRALVTMQGLVIEWVTIKAFHEDFSENGKVLTYVQIVFIDLKCVKRHVQ